VAVVTVWPADAPPVRLDGRIWIRTGPRRGLASAQDERILNEKRRHLDRAFDATPVYGCPLDELDRLTFEREFLPQAIAPDEGETTCFPTRVENGRVYIALHEATA